MSETEIQWLCNEKRIGRNRRCSFKTYWPNMYYHLDRIYIELHSIMFRRSSPKKLVFKVNQEIVGEKKFVQNIVWRFTPSKTNSSEIFLYRKTVLSNSYDDLFELKLRFPIKKLLYYMIRNNWLNDVNQLINFKSKLWS